MVQIKLNEDPTIISLSYQKDSGEITIDLDLSKEFVVSPEEINSKMYTITSEWAKWAAVVDTLTANLQYLKTQKERIATVLSAQFRENWNETTDGKRTENAIRERVETNRDYLEACGLVEEATLQLSYAKTVQEGYSMLQSVLQTLSANLRAAGNFGSPTPAVIETPIPPSELSRENISDKEHLDVTTDFGQHLPPIQKRVVARVKPKIGK